ncbi:cyclin-D1-binding protein 1 homolog isoform X2 [Gambusia affinis]|uniref:cyclin-D1-binding protein 1 homolog isoform X2 n=1 Tax=Gambusia affinis TaxID=33528 RepID=UPI001CDD83D3|nr:cyclin-D1-binding protein 1 homolog isoform X2 [Gambusia affinis]
MSAENCDGTLSVPLRNVLNSIQCIRDRVRDGESNESDGAFNLSNFWDTLNQAVKAVSHEATKLSLAFSRPPLPSLQDGEKLSEFILKSVLTLSTVYYWLPKSQGVTLRRQVRDATVEVLDGILQLVEVIISSPLQSLTQEQITSTGGVWSACDRFAQLPKDNKEALLVVVSSQSGVVKDAVEEMEQVLSETQDPFGDFLIDDPDDDNPRGNRDVYLSEKDRQVISACQGLMKAAAACLRKLKSAVKANGDAAEPQNVAQLDDLADISREISPSVDDLALCLYPPMNYSGVENHTSKLAAILRKFLDLIRSSHVCGAAELTWIQFLEAAVDHNVQKAKESIELDG